MEFHISTIGDHPLVKSIEQEKRRYILAHLSICCNKIKYIKGEEIFEGKMEKHLAGKGII
jgi:hypothetical protein